MEHQWTAGDIFARTGGYREASLLTAAADLDLFAALRDGPRTAAEVAEAQATDLRGTTMLVDALAALGLLVKTGGRYANAPGVGELLGGHDRGSVLAMVRHHGACLRRWASLGEVVKTGRYAERVPSVQGEEADGWAFIEGMDNLAASLAPRIWDDLGALEFTHVLDVGGGSGTWLIPLLERHPDSVATLFDLPHVIPMAEERLTAAGVRDRVTLATGSFYDDPLPAGADLVWLSAIMHQNSRSQNRALFAKIHAALAPGGHLLIRETIMEESRTAPVFGALFAINMLVCTKGGGTFTLSEVREDLESVGFTDVMRVREDEAMYAVVGATKPLAPVES